MRTSSSTCNKPAKDKHIVVEGPIGVGKSSLCQKLAKTFDSPLLLEEPGENPFLARFYQSPGRFALPTQLFFLFQRIRQLNDVKCENRSRLGLIADFMLEKDPLFAQITLDDDEHRLYQQVYENLNINRLQPDLVVYLQAPVHALQQRIRKRKVQYEQGMEDAYLQKLSDAYMTYFHRYTASPLLIVNAAEFNPIENQGHYDALIEQINRVDAGKQFFNPLAT